MDAGEYQQLQPEHQGSGESRITRWTVTATSGRPRAGSIYHYKFQGLNSVGAPQYSFCPSRSDGTPNPGAVYLGGDRSWPSMIRATDALYIPG